MKDKCKFILISVVLVVGLFCVFLKSNVFVNDSLKFKFEYESLNSEVNSHGKQYPKVSISKDNVFKYASYDDVKRIISKGTGVVYFGFPECPWCRNMVAPLAEAVSSYNVDTIYYFNAYAIRDKKHLDDNGNVVVDSYGSDEYYELVSLMSDFLTPYEGLNDDSIKRLYFPTVVFVQNGKIKDIHIGTLDEQEDPYILLNDEQREKLVNIYKDGMKKISSNSCNDKC